MVVDKGWQPADLATNVHARRWVWNVQLLKEVRETLVALEFPWHVTDAEGAGIEIRNVILGGEPIVPELDHSPPVEVDEEADEECDGIGDPDVDEEPLASYVTDGEHAEDVALLWVDVAEVVKDVDGNETTTGDEGDGEEEPSEHTKKAQVRDGVQAEQAEQLRLMGMY